MKSKTSHIHDEIIVQLATDPKLKSDQSELMIQTICEVVSKTLDSDQVSVWGLDFEKFSLKSQDIFEKSKQKHFISSQLKLENLNNFLKALESNRFLDIFNTQKDELFSEFNVNAWEMKDVKSCLIIPIRSKGILCGAIRIDQLSSRRIWIEDEINFACQIGDLIAITNLHFDLKQRDHQYSYMLAFARDLESDLDFQPLVQRFAGYLAGALHADSALVFECDHLHRELSVFQPFHAPPGYEKLKLNYLEGAAGMAADSGTVLIINDYGAYEKREVLYDQYKLFEHVMAEPVKRKDESKFVLQVMRKNPDNQFGGDDSQILGQMVAWFGLLVDQWHMAKRMGLIIDYQNTLSRILETSQFASGVPDLLNTILDYCMPALKSQRALIVCEEWSIARGINEDFQNQLTHYLSRNEDWRSIPVVINSITHSNNLHPDLELLFLKSDIQAFVLTPVMVEDQRIGYMLLANTLPCEWGDDLATMAEITSKHLALEVRRIETLVENEKRENLIWRMNTLGQKLSHVLTYAESIQVVGNIAVELFKPNKVLMLIRTPYKNITNAFSYNIPDWSIQQIVDSESKALEDTFFSVNFPILIPVVANSQMPLVLKTYLTAEKIQSVKILPLNYQDQAVCVIVALYEDQVAWPEYERETINIFARTAVLTLQNAWMYEELEKGYLELALVLADAMESREATLSGMAIKIANWAERTARVMGVSEDEIRDLRWAALLHDIGKSEVPDQVIRKPGPLSDDEWALIQKAPEEGEKYIRPLSRYRSVGNIIRNYHERFDGKGYPDGLKEREIPLGARILAVAEAYGSMIDARAYRKALDPEQANEELRANSGSQFDPKVVDAFISVLGLVSV